MHYCILSDTHTWLLLLFSSVEGKRGRKVNGVGVQAVLISDTHVFTVCHYASVSSMKEVKTGRARGVFTVNKAVYLCLAGILL